MLRKLLDALAPVFEKGGKLEKLYPLFEAADTALYSPADITRGSSHVRDGIDLKRIMIVVWACAFPALLFGMWNVGYQANTLLAAGKGTLPTDWHSWFFLVMIRPTCWTTSPMATACQSMPSLWRGRFWKCCLRCAARDQRSLFVTIILFALIVPPSIPLWQVALGISFGVVIGKEVFGGTGQNMNPALTGRAFLFFAYPAQISGDNVWTAVDGFWHNLSEPGSRAVSSILANGITWWDAFFGTFRVLW